jgi:predicted nucleic acid-binding protein
VFLDTNILLWLYRINNAARAEIIKMLTNLKEERRLCIPSWVVHEYNHHISRRDDTSFFPFKKSVKEIESRLKIIEQHSKLVIDNDYLKGSKHKEKNSFLKDLDETTNNLRSLLKVLTKSRNKNLDDIQVQIEGLMSDCILDSNLNELMFKAENLAILRSKNRVPPGFLDEGKPENEYGDYIIWQEIISTCKEKELSALLITNDKKPDWVYTPRMLLDKSGSMKPNNGSSDIKIDLPLPFLESEFKSILGKDYEFMLSNVELLSHLCSSASYNPKEYGAYGNLAEAVSVESKHDDTYLVISWFLNNDEKYRHAIKTVAYWEYCPSQINDEEFTAFINTNVPDIDINKVNVGEVICELFI